MPTEAAAPQESLSEKIAIAVTPTQKWWLELAAKTLPYEGERGIGPMLRQIPFTEAIEKGQRLAERLAEEVA